MFKKKKAIDLPIFSEKVMYRYGASCADVIASAREYLIEKEKQDYIERIVRNKDEYTKAYFDFLEYRKYEYFIDKLCAMCEEEELEYPGNCCVCNRPQRFIIDYQAKEYIDEIGKVPNWREGMVCPSCGCNSRTRILYAKAIELLRDNATILTCEDDNMIYAHLSRWNVKVDKFHEVDLGMERYDIIISNDARIPSNDYRSFFKEVSGYLKTDGKLLMNISFGANNLETEANEHGCVFGWDIFEILKECGFRDAYGKVYFSNIDGHMGYLSIFFEAVK